MPIATRTKEFTSSGASSSGITLSVAEAKANLSSVLNEVESLRRPVIISRRGVPIAQIVPLSQGEAPKLSGSMAGTGRILGDVVSPLGVEWIAGDV